MRTTKNIIVSAAIAGRSTANDQGTSYRFYSIYGISRRNISGAKELGREGISQSYYFNKVEKGGPFATSEEPQLMAEELRVSFKSLR